MASPTVGLRSGACCSSASASWPRDPMSSRPQPPFRPFWANRMHSSGPPEVPLDFANEKWKLPGWRSEGGGGGAAGGGGGPTEVKGLGLQWEAAVSADQARSGTCFDFGQADPRELPTKKGNLPPARAHFEVGVLRALPGPCCPCSKTGPTCNPSHL